MCFWIIVFMFCIYVDISSGELRVILPCVVSQDIQADLLYVERQGWTNFMMQARRADQSWTEGPCLYACMYIVIYVILGSSLRFDLQLWIKRFSISVCGDVKV